MSSGYKPPLQHHEENGNNGNVEEVVNSPYVNSAKSPEETSPENSTKSPENTPTEETYNANSTMNQLGTEILGSGGYGVVIYPALRNVKYNNSTKKHYRVNIPGVTKIFKKEKNYDAILTLSEKLPKLLGPNNGHRISPYDYQFEGRNLSHKLREKLVEKKFIIRYIDDLWPVHMPNLGIDFTKVFDEYLPIVKNISIITIIEQFIKLMTQVQKLWDSGYIHGDIKPQNIMIDPATGIMTLIDFDWLKPIDIFYKKFKPYFGYYNNPPEFFIYAGSRSNPDDLLDDLFSEEIPEEMRITPQQYHDIQNNYQRWQFTFFDYMFLSYKGPVELMKAIEDANILNREYLDTLHKPIPPKILLKTFDSFGLAKTLISFINDVYSEVYTYTSFTIENFIDGMRNELKVKYSFKTNPRELNALGEALFHITYKVLFPMSNNVIKKRMTIDVGLDKTRAILRNLKTALESNKNKAEGTRALLGLETIFSNPSRSGFQLFGEGGRRVLRSKGTRKLRYKCRKSKKNRRY